MSKVVRFTMKKAGIRALLRSAPIRADLERRGRRIATAAGPGFRVESEAGRNRARVAVVATTDEAKFAEIHDRTLTKSIDAGRGE